MIVKKPLNVNDEDIVDGMSRTGRPLSQPTSVSYSLQRLRLAEISRSLADRTPLIMAQSGGPSYDVVMDIDTELQVLLNEAPLFFSMSIAELTTSYQLETSQAAKIAEQGYMFYSLFYTQRCSLHFPYFSRGFVDSTYASSREICLQSARLAIQTELKLRDSGLCSTTRYKFLGLLVQVFMTSIVLLMDLCHNKSSSPQQERQRAEIADAIRILEDARHESDTAARFLDSLMHVLRKHKVSPSKPTGQQPMDSEQISRAASSEAMIYNTAQPNINLDMIQSPKHPSRILENTGSSIPPSDDLSAGEDISSYFNELAQNFEQGIDVGIFDWTNFFSESIPRDLYLDRS